MRGNIIGLRFPFAIEKSPFPAFVQGMRPLMIISPGTPQHLLRQKLALEFGSGEAVVVKNVFQVRQVDAFRSHGQCVDEERNE
jgi:hypothetical protein